MENICRHWVRWRLISRWRSKYWERRVNIRDSCLFYVAFVGTRSWKLLLLWLNLGQGNCFFLFKEVFLWTMPSLSTFLFISIFSIQWNLKKKKRKKWKECEKKPKPNLKKQKTTIPQPPQNLLYRRNIPSLEEWTDIHVHAYRLSMSMLVNRTSVLLKVINGA